LFAVLTIALAGGATYAALRLPWIEVQHVRVEGAQTLDGASIAEITGIQGHSMLRLDFDSARARLLEVPQVKSASFSRGWPQTVTVHIEERLPWGFWSVGGRDYAVDREGVVLIGGAPSATSPRIVEHDASRVMGPGDRVDPDAIAFAERIARESPRFLGQTVQELEYRAGVGVTVVFTSGLRVTFGDDRAYDYKVAVLSKLLDDLKAKKYAPRAVDLRFGERVTYE